MANDASPQPLNKIGVVGTGTMGRGIAQLTAEAGLDVVLFDVNAEATRNAITFISTLWQRQVSKGRLTEEQHQQNVQRLIQATVLTDLATCDVVIEAVAEKLALKQSLFRELEGIVGSQTVLATNTSSLSVTEIASACHLPERVIGLHFFNPVPLMKIIEVIPGLRTATDVLARALTLGKIMGHFTAQTTDTPGFLVNHAGRAFSTEALRIIAEGVTDHATIDRIMVDQGGFRMGPFMLLDLIGLDVSHAVMESIYHQFYQEPRFRPSPLTCQRLAANLLGRKTQEGFYRYGDSGVEVPPEPAIADAPPRPVWVSQEDPDGARALQALVEKAGWPLEKGGMPSEQALCLLTPLGEDATHCASRQGLNARQCIAIDTFAGLDKRRSLMVTPITDATVVRAAQALFHHDGTPVSTLNDSTGFVLQRLVACIVNIGAEIAQQRIAAPATIDRAVELGLGYPLGPLRLGDHYGGERVLTILNNLQSATGDPRYRASLWLKRRVMLGVGLTTDEGLNHGEQQ
ncbi:MAG: 3-hydroxyacyl-CoA dehydrogenase [Gammaproteobacteria bacterium]|uniref:3-hydroxyacyl-CoA dehydrogenase n=1 Tax=Vreelandella venusta TaxID=44935 RepID=UPI0029B9D751|nr:3-hydroxyacyl-CoA dehydrogenase [Gammaproteobacteria bacterium]MDX1356510.1 3-hydroxyacyl-CoA dehydrogenase [Halomonas venusta]MDX1713557.1 3-hydroxyacyl-CoA dehydrogenase [Halomonas venusta]